MGSSAATVAKLCRNYNFTITDRQSNDKYTPELFRLDKDMKGLPI